MVHSDSDLILHNSSVLIDKEPVFFCCKSVFILRVFVSKSVIVVLRFFIKYSDLNLHLPQLSQVCHPHMLL
ncbi:hypothetical protein AL496_008175 [Enterococcus faecium]|nr:hypothetical protein AL496_008175 [Enterococcus faecium]